MESIYGLFGFGYRFELSTRPENYLGTIETWDMAEAVRTFAYLRLPGLNAAPSDLAITRSPG